MSVYDPAYFGVIIRRLFEALQTIRVSDIAYLGIETKSRDA